MYTPVTTEAEAYARAEEHLATAKRGFPVPLRLEPGLRNAAPVDDADDDLDEDAPEQVTVEVKYICELPEVEGGEDELFARNKECFEALETHWRSEGYEVIARDLSIPFSALAVVHPADRFTIALQQGKPGNLWLRATSPTVPGEYIDPPDPVLF